MKYPIICSCCLSLLFLPLIGKCSDSIYLKIVWQGEVDKPYTEMIFHLSDSTDSSEANFFRHYFTVTNQELRRLSDSIFSLSQAKHTTEPIFYFVVSVRHEKAVYHKQVGSKEELKAIRNITQRIFRGTAIENSLDQVWEQIFSRLQMTAHNMSFAKKWLLC